MRLMFTAGEILSITGNGDPKEELLGDCIETCLGILRVALMYEGCGVDLFGWGSIVEILTGLEHSLLVFNASAYPSGLRNRKIGSSKKNKKSYSYDDCLDVPTEGVPLSKFPIGTIEVTSNETDVEMTDATEVTGFGAAAPSTEVGPSSSFVASGDEAAKRRKLTPQGQLQGLFENALNSIQQIITSDNVCANCFSTKHKIEDCPNVNAPDWINMLISVRDGMESRTSETHDVSISSTEDPPEVSKKEERKEEMKPPPEQPASSKSGILSFHKENKPLHEILGDKEVWNIDVGGKDRTTTGFRTQTDLFDVLRQQIIGADYMP